MDDRPVAVLAELETGAMTSHTVESGMQAAQPAKPAERPDVSGRTLSSVLGAADRTANDQAARHQAELPAYPERTVELVSTSQLTRHEHRTLHDSCEGHDLLAQLPRERRVQPAAARLTSSLVVLGSGDSEIERSTTADIVGALGCSALVV